MSSAQQSLLKQIQQKHEKASGSLFGGYSMNQTAPNETTHLFQTYKMLRSGVMIDNDRRNSVFVDTKKLSELQQLIQNRNNSIVSANANKKMECQFLGIKSELNQTDQDVASTNDISSYNLPDINKNGTSEGKRSRKSKPQKIDIDLIDSEDEFVSEKLSQPNSTRSKHSSPAKEVYTVIKRADFTPAKSKEQEKKEQEELEQRAREEAQKVEEIMKKHQETYINGIVMENKVKSTRSRASESITHALETINKLDLAEKEFDLNMHKSSINERARLEAEKLYTEELKQNHGKPKSYFHVPALSSSRRKNSAQLEVIPPEVKAKSVERNASRKLNRAWGSAVVTKEQAKRAQAKKIDKKEDDLGFVLDYNAGPYKLQPLDPQYQNLVQQHLEAIRAEKKKKFMPFGNGKLRTQQTKIMSQRKYNDQSTSPRQERRRRAASVMMESSDSFVSVDDLSDLEDNVQPTADIKFNTDTLLQSEIKKARALVIENTDEELQTPALLPANQTTGFQTPVRNYSKGPKKAQERDFSALNSESDFHSISDCISNQSGAQCKNLPRLSIPYGFETPASKVNRSISPAQQKKSSKQVTLSVGFMSTTEARSLSSSIRKRKEQEYLDHVEQSLKQRPNAVNRLEQFRKLVDQSSVYHSSQSSCKPSTGGRLSRKLEPINNSGGRVPHFATYQVVPINQVE